MYLRILLIIRYIVVCSHINYFTSMFFSLNRFFSDVEVANLTFFSFYFPSLYYQPLYTFGFKYVSCANTFTSHRYWIQKNFVLLV